MEAIACFRIESQYENACFDPWYNGKKDRDPPRTRTWNLWLRGPTPYPLGQQARCLHLWQPCKLRECAKGLGLMPWPRAGIGIYAECMPLAKTKARTRAPGSRDEGLTHEAKSAPRSRARQERVIESGSVCETLVQKQDLRL